MCFRPHSYLFASLLLLCWPVARAAPPERSSTGDDRVRSPIAEAMGGFRWGIRRIELQTRLIAGIASRYRRSLAEAQDPRTRAHIQSAVQREIRRISDSYIQFDGAATDWDEGFLRGEFRHGHGESMLVSLDPSSRTFYFFTSDKLWKVYRIFEPLAFPEGNFAAFTATLQRRLGPASPAQGVSAAGDLRRWSEWQDDKTRLRAIDQTDHYGFYCLVFEDKATLAKRRQSP